MSVSELLKQHLDSWDTKTPLGAAVARTQIQRSWVGAVLQMELEQADE